MFRAKPPSFPPKGGSSPPLEGLGEAGHSHVLIVNPPKGEFVEHWLHFLLIWMTYGQLSEAVSPQII